MHPRTIPLIEQIKTNCGYCHAPIVILLLTKAHEKSALWVEPRERGYRPHQCGGETNPVVSAQLDRIR